MGAEVVSDLCRTTVVEIYPAAAAGYECRVEKTVEQPHDWRLGPDPMTGQWIWWCSRCRRIEVGLVERVPFDATRGDRN